MATSNQANNRTRIINAATKQELTVVKRNGHYQIGSEVLTGDLYRDTTNLSVAVLVVTGAIQIEELSLNEIPKLTVSNGG